MTSIFQSCIICFDDPLIRNTCQYILSHVNERCAVTDIAKKMYVSKSHLSEQFKHKTKMTLVEYTTHIRMERAKILLKKTNLRNYEIAYQLGYQYGDYFGKVFHKYTGMSLIEFRQMEEKDDKKGETVDK